MPTKTKKKARRKKGGDLAPVISSPEARAESSTLGETAGAGRGKAQPRSQPATNAGETDYAKIMPTKKI